MADHWYDQLRGGAHPERPEVSTDTAGQETAAGFVEGIDRTAALLSGLVEQQAAILARLDQQMVRIEEERHAREDLSARIGQLTAAVEDLHRTKSTTQSMAKMVRDGVADEIRPLLVAIVELLELGVGQSGTAEPARDDGSDDLTLLQGIELPKILTRPLEDLLAPRARPARVAASGSALDRSDEPSPPGGLFGRRRAAETLIDRAPASRRKGRPPWTPVKS